MAIFPVEKAWNELDQLSRIRLLSGVTPVPAGEVARQLEAHEKATGEPPRWTDLVYDVQVEAGKIFYQDRFIFKRLATN